MKNEDNLYEEMTKYVYDFVRKNSDSGLEQFARYVMLIEYLCGQIGEGHKQFPSHKEKFEALTDNHFHSKIINFAINFNEERNNEI